MSRLESFTPPQKDTRQGKPLRPAYDVATELKIKRNASSHLEQKDAFADYLRLQVHADYVERALRCVYGEDIPFKHEILREDLSKHPLGRNVCKSGWGAAAHEAGHFVVAQYHGQPALTASISGSPGGWHGWCGEARFLDLSNCEPQFWKDPETFLCKARIELAGPISQEVVGMDVAAQNVGELMSARVYTDRAAEILKVSSHELWSGTVYETVALVESYSATIAIIAGMIKSRRKIYPTLSVRRALSAITPDKPVKSEFTDGAVRLVESIIYHTPKVDCYRRMRGSDLFASLELTEE